MHLWIVRAVYAAFLRPRTHFWLTRAFYAAFLGQRILSLFTGIERDIYAAFLGRPAASGLRVPSARRF